MLIKAHPEWNEWERVIYHEAGHAAMALCLWKETAPLFLIRRQDENGGIQKEAKYKIKTGIAFRDPGDPRAPEPNNKHGLEQVMVLAAGAMMERLRYGEESNGCTSDFKKISTYLVHHNEQDALDEIKNNYPLSLQKTKEIIDLVEKIAANAIAAFRERDLIKTDFSTIILIDQDTIAKISESFFSSEQQDPFTSNDEEHIQNAKTSLQFHERAFTQIFDGNQFRITGNGFGYIREADELLKAPVASAAPTKQDAVATPPIPDVPGAERALASLVVYDAPSVTAKQLFTISPGTPFEVITEVGSWRKVRNPEGRLGWIAKQ